MCETDLCDGDLLTKIRMMKIGVKKIRVIEMYYVWQRCPGRDVCDIDIGML